MKSVPWWGVSLISSVVAMALFALSFWLPLPWGPITLGIGVLVFVLVMRLNPLYWYRHTAAGLLGGWLVTTAGSRLELEFQLTPSVFGRLVFEHVDWWIHVIAGVIIVVLLILDYYRTAGPAAEALNAPESEFERVLEKVSKRERVKLALQQLQGKSEVFAVDTSNLSKSDQYKLALRQVISRERWRLGILLLIGAAIFATALLLLDRASGADHSSDPTVILPRVGAQAPWVTTDQSGSHTVHVRWEDGSYADGELYWELLPGGPENPDELRFDRGRAVLLPKDRSYKDFSPPAELPEDPHWRFVIESRGRVFKAGPAEPLKVLRGSRS